MTYLQNLALIHLLDYCKKNKIDCSNTYIDKQPRKQVYSLIKNDTKKAILTITFYKNSVPTYSIN